jgi:hypothetical protein
MTQAKTLTSYGYDAASQLSAINYQLGNTSLGNLTYSHDLGGRRTNVGGSFAKTNLPAALGGNPGTGALALEMGNVPSV